MKNKVLHEAKMIGLSIVGGGIALGVLFVVLPLLPKPVDGTTSRSNSLSTTAADGSRLPEVGSTTFIGRTNCDRAVKAILRDPGSYERISAQVVDVKPGEGWAAQVDFRSRNGFGGYDQGIAYCVFNGSQYRALIDE